MSNQAELDVKDDLVLKEIGITPCGESVLAKLGIDPADLKSMKPRWKRIQYRAVINWLTKYQPQPDASNLEQVKGLQETFYHLCEVEDWERASEIIAIRLNTSTNEELHAQMRFWGYHREASDLYSKLLGKSDTRWDAVCWNGLGITSNSIAEYEKDFVPSTAFSDRSDMQRFPWRSDGTGQPRYRL